ncbi:MAG: 16S rRNA (uracil(1498)-N(3))-methyltransferase [Pseudomonadota bacterium]|nr:MAG: 16S rRNA (uracil(1498)-N(3))-methyltransferase [Pseudomonadota bacterium]
MLMTAPWFYCPDLDPASDRATLPATEVSHALGARRLRVGAEVSLFDGRGQVARAQIAAVNNRDRSVELQISERRRQAPSAARHLACALAKGDRQATLFDMATQLGATDLTPLECEHSVVTVGPNSVARWERICLEACKQSRRAYLPRLHAPTTPDALCAARQATRTLIAHPDGLAFARLEPLRTTDDVLLLIGPEGGFTDGEVAAARANGAQTVALGDAILRIETAAVALLALVANAQASN